MPDSVRLSVNVNAEVANAIRTIGAARGDSATETIRRAVALLDLVEREVAAGTRIELHGADGSSRQLSLIRTEGATDASS